MVAVAPPVDFRLPDASTDATPAFSPPSSTLDQHTERHLGQIFARGRQVARRIVQVREQGGTLSRTQLDAAKGLIAAARQARITLIAACAPLVAAAVNHYSGYGISREDLEQEGWLGVVQAADHFNPSKGPCFSQYARYWIKQAILRALTNRSRLIRLPAGVVEVIRKISAAQQEWALSHEGAPDAAALAALTGLPESRIAQALAVMDPPLSLDAPMALNGEESSNLGQGYADPVPGPESIAEHAAVLVDVLAALEGLDPLARTVLRWRFGLADGTAYSANEVAEILGLPINNVRSHEAAGLAALRMQLTPILG